MEPARLGNRRPPARPPARRKRPSPVSPTDRLRPRPLSVHRGRRQTRPHGQLPTSAFGVLADCQAQGLACAGALFEARSHDGALAAKVELPLGCTASVLSRVDVLLDRLDELPGTGHLVVGHARRRHHGRTMRAAGERRAARDRPRRAQGPNTLLEAHENADH